MSWSAETEGVDYDHVIQLNVTDTEPDLLTDFVLRVYAHFVIDQMPYDGVIEAVESLASMRNFYRERLQDYDEVLRLPSTVIGTMAPRMLRPEFELETD